MPEMTDAMYCHQQICVPPTFPYLLRQYAKAAIRSQPNDLLRWSCSYFRALAMGLRPPTKLRLEYPIPRTHYGLTAGWLKTLLYQLAGHNVVTWPQIYDRWRGACLQVDGLQEILLLADFNDPARISWLQFVACAAGHLTANLTNTMILICELLTEEPEGGSASIPYNIFADLYKFLAKIDACEEKEVMNFWFTESNLDLSKQPILEDAGTLQNLERSLASDLEEEEEIDRFHYSDLEKYLKTIHDAEGEEDVQLTPKVEGDVASEAPPAAEPEPNCYIILDPEDGAICDDAHSKSESSSSGSSSEPSQVALQVKEERAEVVSEEYSYTPEETEQSKQDSVSSSFRDSSEGSKENKLFKLVSVPGIGGVVKTSIVQAVLKYMQEVSNKQKGMVMPRNIKHFLCPPLEECY